MTTESVQEQIVQNQVEESQAVAAADSPKGTIQRAVLMFVSLLLAVGIAVWGMQTMNASDPYVQSVLQISGNVSRGQEIFQMNCAVCHGLDGDGEVGPELHGVAERKSQVALIDQVISGKTPPMPQFQPNEKDMADLLSYLETL